MSKQIKRAFTLLELIVVVLIISLIGFLTFSVMAKGSSKKKEQVEILNLKSTLTSNAPKEDRLFFCIEQNKKCFVATGDKIVSYEGSVKLSQNMETYILDSDRRADKIDDFGKYKDSKISFAYKLYANGSAQPLILKDESGVYFFPSYFGEPTKVKEVDDARVLWIKDNYNLRDSGGYY